MRVRYLILVFVFFGSTAKGQISNVPGLGNEIIRVKKYSGINGSPYLFDNWETGSIVDDRGKIYNNVLLRYDAYKDCIEINQSGSLMALDAKMYNEFRFTIISDDSSVPKDYVFRNGFPEFQDYNSGNYYNVLYDHDIVFLKKLNINFIDQNVVNYGSTTNFKEFQRKDRYFILVDGEIQELKISKKGILSVFPNKQKELENFIKNEKLKVRTEEDVVNILSTYSKL